MLFEIVQMLYWLALAAWFGLVLFGAMATPVVFRTVQDADPTLPTVLSVNLDGQHSALLSITIVAQVLARLVWMQVVCAVALAVALAAQWLLIGSGGGSQVMFISVIRSALYLAAVGLLVYGWRVVWPRAAQQRKRYIDNADNPEEALPARDQLTKLQRESEIVQLALATVLSALILFSANLRPPTSLIG
ncbi:MAG TPA: hypothetical protein VF796_17785 [Humisphaera sp.]